MPPFKGELFEHSWTRGIAPEISQGQTPRFPPHGWLKAPRYSHYDWVDHSRRVHLKSSARSHPS